MPSRCRRTDARGGTLRTLARADDRETPHAAFLQLFPQNACQWIAFGAIDVHHRKERGVEFVGRPHTRNERYIPHLTLHGKIHLRRHRIHCIHGIVIMRLKKGIRLLRQIKRTNFTYLTMGIDRSDALCHDRGLGFSHCLSECVNLAVDIRHVDRIVVDERQTAYTGARQRLCRE